VDNQILEAASNRSITEEKTLFAVVLLPPNPTHTHTHTHTHMFLKSVGLVLLTFKHTRLQLDLALSPIMKLA